MTRPSRPPSPHGPRTPGAIRAVTFDCWGTLITDHDVTRAAARGEVTRSSAGGARARALLDAAQGRLAEDEAWELLGRAWQAHHQAWVAGRQYGSPAMARFCAEALERTDDGFVEQLCTAFEDAGASGEIEALDGARDALAALRDSGIRTALVCDTGFSPGRVVRGLLDRHGLLPHLEVLVFSNEVGVPKPHSDMFRTALDALGVPPKEAVHVGDLRRTDVAGARAVGMRTVRIRDVHDDTSDHPDADAVVGSHAELLETLTAWGVTVRPRSPR